LSSLFLPPFDFFPPDEENYYSRRNVLIALFCQQEINGLAGLIHGPIEVIPVAFDLDQQFPEVDKSQ
jgi:hypothetical protein